MKTDSDQVRTVRASLADIPTGLRCIFVDGDAFLAADDDVLGPDAIIATFAPELSQFSAIAIARAAGDVEYLLTLVDRAAKKIKAMNNGSPSSESSRRSRVAPGADYAAEAAMKCDTPRFREYLTVRHDMPADADKDAVAEALRKALKIKSRGELNAAGRWLKLRDDFDAWMRQP